MLPKLLTSIFGSRNERLLKQYRREVEKISAMEPQFEALDDAALRAKTDELRQRLAGGASLDDLLPAFQALYGAMSPEQRLAADRLLGRDAPHLARVLRG